MPLIMKFARQEDDELKEHVLQVWEPSNYIYRHFSSFLQSIASIFSKLHLNKIYDPAKELWDLGLFPCLLSSWFYFLPKTELVPVPAGACVIKYEYI